MENRAKLSADAIVDTAIERIESAGIGELSARKLAADLGCEAMSLYHHVGSMDALKDLIVDRLVGSVPASGGSPAAALNKEAKAYLSLAERRPRTFGLIATRRWKGERAIATAARVAAHFQALGLDPAEALARARALGAYLNGAGLALAAWATDGDQSRREEAGRVKADLQAGLARLLVVLTDPRG